MARTPGTTSSARVGRDGSFWSRLNEAERAALAEIGSRRTYSKGATIIGADDRARWAIIVLSGRVRVFNGNGTQVVATRLAGDIVGEQRIIDGRPQITTVRAETTVKALVVNGPDLERLVGQLPRILWVMCLVLSERLRESYTRLALQSTDAFTRIVSFLVHSAPADQDGDRPFTVPIGTQAALGERLDVSRDSVIRALRRLRAGQVVVASRGLVTVRDPRKLHAYLTP